MALRAQPRTRRNWTVPPTTVAATSTTTIEIAGRPLWVAATPAPMTSRSPRTGIGSPASFRARTAARRARAGTSTSVSLEQPSHDRLDPLDP